MLRLAIVAACAVGVLGGCPNLCSGHGSCSGNDECNCFSNWQGPDCSLRTCAYGNAWALDATDPHGYDECSGGGLCDRASGECKCFEGFTGHACQRRECPNDCSGHGVCRSLAEIKALVPYSSEKWDADQLQACICDAGFFGTDCSQRRCPTGDDPLTTCVTETKAVQEIKITLGSKVSLDTHSTLGGTASKQVKVTAAARSANTDESMSVFGTSSAATLDAVLADESIAQFRVGAVDAAGQTYYAPTAWKAAFSPEKGFPVSVTQDKGATSLELALENIAGFKVRDVQVSAEHTTGGASSGNGNGLTDVIQKRYLVTFIPDKTNSANVGLQNPLVCESGYACSSAGCQPMVKMPFLYRYAATTLARTTLDAGDASVTAPSFMFYTDSENTDANFALKKFIRLHAESMPRMPLGVSIDDKVKSGDLNRYDIRVVVAVQATTPAQTSTGTDVYWTKVVFGHSNIAADKTEYNSAAASVGPFSATTDQDFYGTLRGFTYRGFIPSSLKATIPEAPGVILSFASADMIDTTATGLPGDVSKFKFFEILVKLPLCTVTRLISAADFTGVDASALVPMDPYVENVECSNRGQCNRDSGMCECYEGYYGVACHKQTVLV